MIKSQVALIGGAGFVGSRLAKRLNSNQNHSYKSLDIDISNSSPKYIDSKVSRISN